jgi:hypothetical protein
LWDENHGATRTDTFALMATWTTRRRSALTVGICAALGAAGCAAEESSGPLVLLTIDGALPGDVVALVATESADGRRSVEWAERRTGAIMSLDIDAADASASEVARIDVATEGEQRGMLGHAVIDGRRFVTYTEPDSFELLVAEVNAGGELREVWSAGEAGDGAIGGVLAVDESGDLLLGLGRNTEWDANTAVGGAILGLDPDAGPDQEEVVISVGYTNPWAFTVIDDGSIWVADNAAGPDPDDESRDDVERIGRADEVDDRNDMAEVSWDERAPSAMVELADGRIGICGFLDNELRAYEVVDGDPATLDRAGPIMDCLTGAAVFDDGTIVTAAQSDSGEVLQILRP